MVKLEVQDFLKNKEQYKQIENILKRKLGESVSIDHVGSTAIPDMCGKNIIDILVGADDEFEFDKFKQTIKDMGYIASEKSKTDIYQFFKSKDGETSSGDSHIHLVIKNTERYKEFIILRDYLLSNKEEVNAYIKCKEDLIKNGIIDRMQYRAQKSLYVTKLIERAKQNYKKK